MKDLKKIISKFFNRKEYGVESAESSADAATEALCERWRDVEEEDVVGFHHHSTPLVQKLTGGKLKLGVVSIVGTCGLGKTTLARKLYNNVEIKSHFNCRAWVSISQNFKTRDVLLEILKSEMPQSDELTRKKLFKYSSDDELKKKLFKCLQGRRYLIVMDDNIWRTEVWDEVRSAFPDDSNRSRILITSRLKEASHASHTSDPYLLPFLNKDESWELFNKKVFRGVTCPPELKTLGRKIVKHCRGLPLSIVVLGSLLASEEKTHRAWSRLISILKWDLMAPNEICKDILASTYTLLPPHLKPCFLYLGVYPQGFEIRVSQLVQLWIAEGFIQHTGPRDLEDVAEEYLEKLISRGLIQVASRRIDGGVKICRIHALMRDLCILESAKAKFLEVCTNVNLLLANKSQILCIQGSIDPYISSNPSHPSRSLLFLGQHTYGFDPNHWKWVLENFKLLRVLNFGCVDLYSIPTRIEELIHLRYLGVESDALKAIPDSIGKLINLETLDFRGTFLNCLPKGIWMLPHLKNLYTPGPVSLPDNLDPEVRALSSLQALCTVSLNPQRDCPIVKAKLPNLRKLGIWFAADEINNEVVDVLNCLHHLDHLQILKIINCSERPSLPISFPLSITKITLLHVRIKVRRDMRVLGKLPYLQVLKLLSCLLSSKLYVFAGSFPELQVLKLENLSIKKWKQRRGAMPRLKHLVIKQCIELTVLPSNLWSLTALRDVELLWSTSDLAKMLWEMQMKVGFKLLVYPPATTDDLFEKTVNGSESRVSKYLARQSPPTYLPLPSAGVLPSQPIAPPLRPLVVHPIPHEFQRHPFSQGIRDCNFSSGLELGSFVVTSNVLHRSWAAISELYSDIIEAPSSSSSSASHVRFETFQQSNCTIIVFVTWPPCTKEHLQGGGGRDFVSSSALKETFPLFEFLCTKTNPLFSINKPAIELFASLRGVLNFLKSQISTKPLIITGHALGGSVASLFTLWLLDTINLATTKRPLCITFGSPLIGDDGLQEAVLQYPAWNSCFLHVVSDRDPVPRVLISPHNPTAPELASPTNGYKPFGTFLLYSELGCACLENPESVLELLMALETYAKGPGNQYPNQVLEFFDYKNMVQQLEGNVICKDSTIVDEWIAQPLQAGIITQLAAIGLGRPQVNHHHSPGSSTKTTTPETSRNNSKQTEGPLRSKSNADQNGRVEERPQPQAGKVITPNLKLFKLAELQIATQNFSCDTELAWGCFGVVYKGWVDETTYAPSKVGAGVAVAVKKSNPYSQQGLEEWLAEVKFLGKFSHPNLVKLLGYCWQVKEHLLVYEYMQKGSLENHLFRRSPEPLSWNTRLKIAIGAARGLSFLHTSEMIYRDFTPGNIMLDGDYNAKLSDFGLSKLGPINGNSHGTYGYAAPPEYVETGNLSIKSNVYSFGVVLLEMLTGLSAYKLCSPGAGQGVVPSVKSSLSNKKRLKKLMDPRLGELYPLKGACQAAKLILRCLKSDPKNRPSMEQVLEELENINAIKDSR